MAKQKLRFIHWNTCNKALVYRGSITFWPDENVIQAGINQQRPTPAGPQHYS
ncbi:IS5/IS1182 family transposase, partial [Escherichia coli]|nr:IS5/IS1182 family transposase [Escherichia coli]